MVGIIVYGSQPQPRRADRDTQAVELTRRKRKTDEAEEGGAQRSSREKRQRREKVKVGGRMGRVRGEVK